MKTIPLTQGKVAIVDDEDYEFLAQYKWTYSGRYAHRRFNRRLVYMHRLLMGSPEGMCVDHINGDPLDNRRSNLRLCSLAENNHNLSKRSDSANTFKGVCLHRATGLWNARIRIGKRTKSLGYYRTEQEAAEAYDKGAKAQFGEFARLNFPERG